MNIQISSYVLAVHLIFCFAANGQPTPEHVYQSTSLVRENHPVYGAVYQGIFFDGNSIYFEVFDSLHHSIQYTLPVPPAGLFVTNIYLSSHDFYDDDPGYEIVFVLSNGVWEDFRQLIVYDDDGSVIAGPVVDEEEMFASSQVYDLTHVAFADGTKHLWADNNVYHALDLSFIHSYDTYYPDEDLTIKPFKAPSLDWKYSYSDAQGFVKLLNSDFSTFQQTQVGNYASNLCGGVKAFLDQFTIDPNPEVEFMYADYCNGQDVLNIYSGNNIVYSIENTSGPLYEQIYWPEDLPGITGPKLFQNHNLYLKSKVYDLTTGNLEFESTDQSLYPFANGSSNTLLCQWSYNPNSGATFPVYDVHYNPISTVTIPGDHNGKVVGVSNTAFDNNPDTYEVIGIYDLPDVQGFFLEIFNNDGTVLLALDSAVNAYVSRLNGASDKLIVQRGKYVANRFEIYDLPFDSTLVSTQEPGDAPILSVWPNPVTSRVYIQGQTLSSDDLCHLQITNTLGRIVWQQQVNTPGVVEVDAQNWPAGLYVVQVVSGGKTKNRTVVKQP